MNPPDRPLRVLLAGATSQVGLFALPRLLDAGCAVWAVSRRVSGTARPRVAPAGLRWLHPDAISRAGAGSEPDDRLLQDVAALLSCGPVQLAARWAPLCPGLQRVVCLSTSSLYTKQASADRRERRLMAAIAASEDELRDHCRQRGITLALLRPTLIYGCGLDRNISRIARLARRLHFVPVAGRAGGLRQPVHADDLARLAVGLLAAADMPAIESPVGGGSVLTYRDMVARTLSAAGLAPRILAVPAGLLAGLAGALSWLPGAAGLNAGFVRRQAVDMVFDDTRLRAELAYQPRPFAPAPEDFTVPERARTLQPWP